MIPVSRPHIWGNEAAYVKLAIDEGWISSKGRYIDAFEKKFAETLGTRHAVSVTNGTAALHIALDILGIRSGDEVIVPAFCMASPIFAVLYCGATPVPVDADETWNLDPSLIEAAITSQTRAILIVHTYGHPARIDPIIEIARRHGLAIVEDTAEALGATVEGRLAGTFGDIACFSFYANKVITTGEGGMLVMNDSELYARAKAKRDLCFGTESESRFVHDEIGYNYRFTNMQAALGLAQMEHFAEAVDAKIEIGEAYNRALAGVPGLVLPPRSSWATNVYWAYGVVIEKEFGLDRSTVQYLLGTAGIETRRFFTSLHQQPFFKSARTNYSFPKAEHLSADGFYLPSYIGMPGSALAHVADTLRSIQRREFIEPVARAS
jgi:perosamine synthetase